MIDNAMLQCCNAAAMLDVIKFIDPNIGLPLLGSSSGHTFYTTRIMVNSIIKFPNFIHWHDKLATRVSLEEQLSLTLLRFASQ